MTARCLCFLCALCSSWGAGLGFVQPHWACFKGIQENREDEDIVTITHIWLSTQGKEGFSSWSPFSCGIATVPISHRSDWWPTRMTMVSNKPPWARILSVQFYHWHANFFSLNFLICKTDLIIPMAQEYLNGMITKWYVTNLVEGWMYIKYSIMVMLYFFPSVL